MRAEVRASRYEMARECNGWGRPLSGPERHIRGPICADSRATGRRLSARRPTTRPAATSAIPVHTSGCRGRAAQQHPADRRRHRDDAREQPRPVRADPGHRRVPEHERQRGDDDREVRRGEEVARVQRRHGAGPVDGHGEHRQRDRGEPHRVQRDRPRPQPAQHRHREQGERHLAADHDRRPAQPGEVGPAATGDQRRPDRDHGRPGDDRRRRPPARGDGPRHGEDERDGGHRHPDHRRLRVRHPADHADVEQHQSRQRHPAQPPPLPPARPRQPPSGRSRDDQRAGPRRGRSARPGR